MKAALNPPRIVMFGAHGTALTILQQMQEIWQGSVTLIAMIDELDHGYIHPKTGVPVISMAQYLREYRDIAVLLGVGSNALRARVMADLAQAGAQVASAWGGGRIYPQTRIGAGTICGPDCRIGPDVVIGQGAQIHCDWLAHDIEIGDYAFISMGVTVAGNVRIGPHVTIGPGASILNGRPGRALTIGAGAIIAAGAAVLGNVPEGAHMVGNPAMPMRDWIRLRRLARR